MSAKEDKGKELEQVNKVEGPEDALEQSWEFLTGVTEKVSVLPQSEQDRIMELGKQLSAAGASYDHIVPNPNRRQISPAKEAALKKSAAH
jgi:hypothetical protein